jgi:hypothetical protein
MLKKQIVGFIVADSPATSAMHASEDAPIGLSIEGIKQ